MANGHGGYRPPTNPAPASGPGKLSQRTDQPKMQLPNAEYGEQQAYQAAQAGAPMAGGGGGMSGAPTAAPVPVTPFGAPSARPGEPVTAGAALGAGPGVESLGLMDDKAFQEQDRQKLVAYLPVLEFLANRPDAMPSLRQLVRKVKATAGL